LPEGVCSYELGRSIDGMPYSQARATLIGAGFQAEADSLGNFDDIYRECGVLGCSSFVTLSNQAGEIMLLDHGTGPDGCIKT